MKKLIVLALLIVGTTIVAQQRNRQAPGNKQAPGNRIEQFTAEQKSQLMLKKMTLELDLTDAQQKDMSAFISEKTAKKEALIAEMKAKKEKGVRPTKDERFAMAMKMMDEKIASKKTMQKILNAKQYEKWASLIEDHQGKNKGNRQGNRKGSRQGKQHGNQVRKG